MSIISRYILREFFRLLALTTISLIMIYMLVDFFEKIDNFIESGLSWETVAWFFAMSIPNVFFLIAPVAILVAILISIGILARNSEVVAMKASGVSLYRLSIPMLVASLGLSLMMFLLSDHVIPYTSAQVNKIWDVDVEGQGARSSGIKKDVWFRDKSNVYNFKTYNSRAGIIDGVSLFVFGDQFHLLERVEAVAAFLEKGKWIFYDGMVKSYHPDGQISVDFFKEHPVNIARIPEEVGEEPRATSEMSSSDLSRWITAMEEGGYDSSRYIVDLHLKFAFPFICTIMTLIGLPIAFWKEKGGGIALGIGVGVGLSFCYLVFLGLSRALGYSGLLSPAAAAWLPNTLFLVLGLSFFSFVKQ